MNSKPAFAGVVSITRGTAVQSDEKHPSSLTNFISIPSIVKKRKNEDAPSADGVQIFKEMKQCAEKQILRCTASLAILNPC